VVDVQNATVSGSRFCSGALITALVALMVNIAASAI
jgi:hypothetical protein